MIPALFVAIFSVFAAMLALRWALVAAARAVDDWRETRARRRRLELARRERPGQSPTAPAPFAGRGTIPLDAAVLSPDILARMMPSGLDLTRPGGLLLAEAIVLFAEGRRDDSLLRAEAARKELTTSTGGCPGGQLPGGARRG